MRQVREAQQILVTNPPRKFRNPKRRRKNINKIGFGCVG